MPIIQYNNVGVHAAVCEGELQIGKQKASFPIINQEETDALSSRLGHLMQNDSHGC